MSKADEVREGLKYNKPRRPLHADADFLSTGSTLLDLGCSGRLAGGFAKGKYYFLVGDSDSGKAQPLTAKVLTPYGWKRMGDLSVGDEVVDPDGGSGRVEGIYPQGRKEVYRVSLSDHTSTECCGDHLWLVETMNDRSRGTGGRVLHLRDMVDRVKEGGPNRNAALYLPEIAPVEFAEGKSLYVHPYLMGALLGNGLFGVNRLAISTTESEIQEAVISRLPDGHRLSLAGKSDFSIRGEGGRGGWKDGKRCKNRMREWLKKIGLGYCKAEDKFIPKRYLYASIEDRIHLLHGLMDTDGYATKDGFASYSSASWKLARDVAFLVRSLGGRASIRVKESPAYTHKGERRTGQDSYGIAITVPSSVKLFTLKRKADRYDQKWREPRPRRIVSVESVGVKECRCIRVSTKRRLYLTDSLIPTHNSFLSMSCFAEACLNPSFKGHRLIHDDVEGGVLMDVAKMFGPDAASRIEPPAGTREKPRYSSTVEEFFYHLDDAFKAKEPFVYVLDSEDALPPEAWLKTQDKKRKAALRGKEDQTGSYGTEKAKANSAGMRAVIPKLRDSGSILLIISQTRDNIGWNSQFQPKTHGGGHALTFYATVKMWSSVKKRLKVSYRDKDRVQGILAGVDIKRTRFTGRPVKVEVPIYWSSGIDDVGSCVDWLVEEKVWKEGEGGILVPEWDVSHGRDDLVSYVEEASLEVELRQIVAGAWAKIEAATVSGRKNKYAQEEG